MPSMYLRASNESAIVSGVAARRSLLRVVGVIEVAGVEGVAARELPDAGGAGLRSRGCCR